VESTLFSKDVCGLYLPMSAKAVTKRKLPLGFITREEVFRYSAVISISWGCQKSQSHAYWGEVAFTLERLNRAHVNLCLVGSCKLIVPRKHVVPLCMRLD